MKNIALILISFIFLNGYAAPKRERNWKVENKKTVFSDSIITNGLIIGLNGDMIDSTVNDVDTTIIYFRNGDIRKITTNPGAGGGSDPDSVFNYLAANDSSYLKSIKTDSTGMGADTVVKVGVKVGDKQLITSRKIGNAANYFLLKTDWQATPAYQITTNDIAAWNALLDNDTTTIFVFGAGGGNNIDTNCFSTSTIYGSFKNTNIDTIYITGINAVMGHGVGIDTLTIQIYWNDTLNANNPTVLNTNPLPIISTTVGTADSDFANYKIAPGNRVWCKTPYVVAARKPEYLEVTLSGYYKK